MKKTYYLFNPGQLERKDNTLKFTPVVEDGNGEESVGAPRYLPVEDINEFYVFGSLRANSSLFNFLGQKDIAVHFFDYYENYTGSFMPKDSLLSGRMLLAQTSAFQNKKKRLLIAQKFIESAAYNMIKNLQYYNRRGKDMEDIIDIIKGYAAKLRETVSVDELMGTEGMIRQTYYDAFNLILNDFEMGNRTKQPPQNEVNALTIEYRATTDKATVVNLTNHGFFNLAGISNPTPTVNNHIVTINADFYTPIDEVSIPTGEIAKVEGTPMDFRAPHTVGERIDDKFQQLIFGAGYDHCYVLNKMESGSLDLAATCKDPESGRIMEVYTTEAGVQLYTGNWLNGFEGAHGATFPARSAICFEAQCFPDTPNKPHFPSATLLPGDEYQQITVYKFTVEE